MIKIIPKTIKSNRRSHKRSVAAVLLAVIGFIAYCSSTDFNTRFLEAKRGSMKFQFTEETLRQAQDFQKHGQQFESTIATAFFQFKDSKHDIEEYLAWAKNSLCITDAMVIFTNVPEKIAPLREHAKDRTVIVPMEIEDVQVGNDIHITDEQWEMQNTLKEANTNLYKVWAGKSWLTTQAVELNPFRSDVYHWMDIGHFRDGPYFCGETVVRHPEIVPEDQMMMFMIRGVPTHEIDAPESVVTIIPNIVSIS